LLSEEDKVWSVQAFMQLVTRLLRTLRLVQGEGTIYPAGEPAEAER